MKILYTSEIKDIVKHAMGQAALEIIDLSLDGEGVKEAVMGMKYMNEAINTRLDELDEEDEKWSREAANTNGG